MAINITSLKEAVGDNGLKILVHGPAGAGKTVLGATTGQPTLIISAEAGLLSIKDAPDYIKTVQINSITDLYGVYEYLMETVNQPLEDREFKWIVLDSISEIAEVVLAHEKSITKDPRAAYGQLQEQMGTLMRRFRDMPHYHIMMTCKQQRITDDSNNTTLYMPSLPGRLLGQSISYMFDEVFALRVERNTEDGSVYRCGHFSRTTIPDL